VPPASASGSSTSAPLLAALLDAAAATPSATVREEDANVRLYTRRVDPAVLVEAGELVYDAGGLQSEHDTRTRMLAFPGPEATLRGLAYRVGWIANLSDTGTWLSYDTIARALLAYNAAYVDLGKGPDGKWRMAQWRVGMRLTLPIELELSTGSGPRTVTRVVASKARLAELAGSGHWKPEWPDELLATPAELLPIGDPDALATEVAARLALPWDASGLGAELRVALLTNPYAAVLRFVETLRQLRRDRPERRLELLLELTRGLQPESALTLGFTTAGHAALRAAWPVLEAADPSGGEQLARAKQLCASALGLKPSSGGGWEGPLEVGPAVEPEEPPLTPAQAAKVTSGVTELSAMVLGRLISTGPVGVFRGWKGPAHVGVSDPTKFVDTHRGQVLGGSPTPVQSAALDVALKIAGNEGRLDAARAQDSVLLSSGIQQWSIKNNDELTVLLERFQRQAPEHYDLLFGLYGLQLATWTRATDGKEVDRPTDDEIAADNPYLGTASPYGAGFASFVTLRQLPPGEQDTPLPTAGRLSFFGGVANDKGGGASFSALWPARARFAALASIDYCIAQIDTAVFRFQRILDTERDAKPAKPPQFRQARDVRTLYSSQFAAALLLDEHINQPAAQPDSVTRALKRTLETDADPYISATSSEFDRGWLAVHAIDYMQERLLRRNKGVLEANPVMPARNVHLLRRHDRGLSAILDSFKGWV
jgi:hypothetical protein